MARSRPRAPAIRCGVWRQGWAASVRDGRACDTQQRPVLRVRQEKKGAIRRDDNVADAAELAVEQALLGNDGTAFVTLQASGTSANLARPVDVVLVVDTYHHLPDRPTYFRELQKSLAPGGRVAIIDFRKDSPDGPPPEFRFEADQIVGEMKQAGYRLDAKHDFLPRQHFLVFRPATGSR